MVHLTSRLRRLNEVPRKMREERPLVYVFSEGESEQAYVDFLKEHFEENVRIMYHKGTGLFD